MNILVTGGGGYVGSIVIPKLIDEGNHIKCLDRFFFGTEFLSKPEFKSNLELIKDDIRWFNPKILENVDVVLDLAALSNDPVGDLDPAKTFDINYLGRSRVARLSKKFGVKKYILASSASIYGQQKEIVNETSPLNPLTAYSKANNMAEVDNMLLNDENFSVTVLRFASIYGLSPRMRFDLAVNSMVRELFNTGKIVVRGKNNTRPMLHLHDAAMAYSLVINAPFEKISGQLFNVGSNDQNFKMDVLAKEVGDAIGKPYELEVKDTQDHRSYVASFDKIKNMLGFTPKKSVSAGSLEIYNALDDGTLVDSKKNITLEWYKHLQSIHSLSSEVSLRGTIL